jgi:hypothetical protein
MTQIALAYAYRHLADYPACLVACARRHPRPASAARGLRPPSPGRFGLTHGRPARTEQPG